MEWIEINGLDDMPKENFNCILKRWRLYTDGMCLYSDALCFWNYEENYFVNFSNCTDVTLDNEHEWKIDKLDNCYHYSYLKIPEFKRKE